MDHVDIYIFFRTSIRKYIHVDLCFDFKKYHSLTPSLFVCNCEMDCVDKICVQNRPIEHMLNVIV